MPMLAKTWMSTKEQAPEAREWFIVDADGLIVGRLATQLAIVLMGKHKASYTPHVDCGDGIIVTNVERIRFTGDKMQHPKLPYHSTKMATKEYARYSGYPSGLNIRTAVQVWEKAPEQILSEAVRRMLPKNRLGRQMLKKLKLFVGTDHPHQAQQARPLPDYLMPKQKNNE
jgi:large subunit ribosomal protein L13